MARLLRPAVAVRPDEVRAVSWSFAYFFCLLSGYYVLRPLRDAMGIAGGVDQLQWLFTGTFIAMLLAVPLFGMLVARFPRRRIVPLAYRFFIANILLFWLLFQTIGDPGTAGRTWIARAFFIWVSLYNLFVVSIFWSFMADLFRSEQGKRLFGFIAAGGTAGAVLGPTLTATLAGPLGPINLLLVSALLLELAVQCVRRLLAETGPRPEESKASKDGPAQDHVIGGSILAGITMVLRSPYLLGICLYILLYTATGTFVYFEQARIVAGAFAETAARTQFFALVDLAVNLLTVLAQIFLTGRLMNRLGVGPALALLPLLTAAGFLVLSLTPTLIALAAFQILRRAASYAVAKPAREVLFTVVAVEEKYKSKNFIDTVVYRGGDAASGWIYAGLGAIGLSGAAIALVAVPLAVAWAAAGLLLGRRQGRLAAAQS